MPSNRAAGGEGAGEAEEENGRAGKAAQPASGQAETNRGRPGPGNPDARGAKELEITLDRMLEERRWARRGSREGFREWGPWEEGGGEWILEQSQRRERGASPPQALAGWARADWTHCSATM